VAAPALTVLADGFTFLEGPRWHAGRLYASDFYTHRVVAVAGDGTVETILELDDQPSGLGWLPDGTMLVVSMRQRRLLRIEDDKPVTHADLSGLAPSLLNDMVVDASGRAWVGNFGSDILAHAPLRSTNLLRADPDGTVAEVATGLAFPNGSVITPDGSTLLVAETFGNRISGFDVTASGDLANRRDWARFGDPPTSDDLGEVIASGQLAVAPDGMTLDAEGAVWVADALHGRVVRVAGGAIVDEISTGELALGVFACALGGDDGRTLHLMAAPTFDQTECANNPKACILTTRVEVPHAGLP